MRPHAARDLDRLLLRRGHVVHIQDLLAIGLGRREVAFLHRSGRLLRPRIGWYCSPFLPAAAVHAVRVGGVLGCAPAAASWGLMVPERQDGRVHVSLSGNASRLRRGDDGHRVSAGDDHHTRWHWEQRLREPLGYRVSPVDSVVQLAACTTLPWLIAALDSGIRSGLLLPGDVEAVQRALPAAMHPFLAQADGIPESAGESLAKIGLIAADVPFRMQIRVGNRRADFLIDDWIVFEVDGSAHHSGPDAFADDRRRDAELALLGFRTVRASHRQVVDDWPTVLAVLRAVRAERRPVRA